MASGIDWFRWHHGSVTDTKLRLVAKKSNAKFGDVIALLAFILEIASSNGNSITDNHLVEASDLLRIPESDCREIIRELIARGFMNGNSIANPRRYFPSVQMRPSGGMWESIRSAIFGRDDYTCQYCGSRGVRLECDHVVPVADGGSHDSYNLLTACFDCNRSKGSKSLSAWEASRGW